MFNDKIPVTTEAVKRALLLAAGTGMLLSVFSTPAMSSGSHGKLFQEVGGTWYVCLCTVSDHNCQPCQ